MFYYMYNFINERALIFVLPIVHAYLTVGGKRSTHSKPTATWGEHTNTTQKDPTTNPGTEPGTYSL